MKLPFSVMFFCFACRFPKSLMENKNGKDGNHKKGRNKANRIEGGLAFAMCSSAVYKNVTFYRRIAKEFFFRSHNFIAIARLLILALKTYYGFEKIFPCRRTNEREKKKLHQQEKEGRYKLCKKNRENEIKIMEIIALKVSSSCSIFTVNITVL